MTAVANILDVNGDGFIDYYEFVSALHPSRDPYRRAIDGDQINEEVVSSTTVYQCFYCIWNIEDLSKTTNKGKHLQVSRQVSQCSCPKTFQVEQITANRYKVSRNDIINIILLIIYITCFLRF